MKKYFIIFLSMFIFFTSSVTTFAVSDPYAELNMTIDKKISIVSTDPNGIETVLLEVDAEKLKGYEISFFSNTSLPSPDVVARKVPGLKDYIGDDIFYKYCSWVLIDLGPEWQNTYEEGEDTNLSTPLTVNGRYLYVFYGRYIADEDNVFTGATTALENGRNSYKFTFGDDYPNSAELEFNGPYALISYNSDTNEYYTNSNTYVDNMGWAYSLSFTGVIPDVDSDFPEFYPRMKFWADRNMNYFDFFGHNLVMTQSYFWSEGSWFIEGIPDDFNESNLQDKGFWEDLKDIFGEDNPAVDLIVNALKGISDFIAFIQEIPEYFETIISIFPEPFADFLKVCAGILVTLIIFKIALHFIG